jgi:hypothetical protein
LFIIPIITGNVKQSGTIISEKRFLTAMTKPRGFFKAAGVCDHHSDLLLFRCHWSPQECAEQEDAWLREWTAMQHSVHPAVLLLL